MRARPLALYTAALCGVLALEVGVALLALALPPPPSQPLPVL